ncbi:MbnP family protein [Aquimarina sp. 2201CG5-10]|uniref:MbnP family protein n=1 Tax=Aquimarina callyspongiae TaxID=3098150 RepID=UPI002AB5D53E|nr:MbnP family protein [Aquimarina sp. 2201CG5-10]MDY8135081.1 MbnP family protein [Aquimarina sp. 2201CG5-10]
MKKILIIALTLVTVLSCKSDDDNNGAKVGSLNLDFTNIIDNNPIELSRGAYTNGSSETYTISELKYIISNIVLVKANGEEFKYPVADSYFLINEEVSTSKEVGLTDITSGEYTKIKFGFGVDQSNYPLNGVNNFIPTAEESGMLWSWSAGYKFLKFEGTYSMVGVPNTNTPFLLHVGSHGTTLDNYKEITLDLPNTLSISANNTANITIKADVAKIFDSTNSHSLQDKSDIQVDPVNAPLIAENVSTMFSITNVSN